MTKYENIGTSSRVLERFGVRAREGLERNVDASPLLPPFMTTLVPIVAAYSAVLNEVSALETETQRLNGLSREASDALSQDMRGWFALVGRDVPEFDEGQYPRTDVVDDRVNQSRRFIAFVAMYQAKAVQGLSYADELLARQVELADRAEAAKLEAKDAMVLLGARRRDLRASATQLNAELVAFRRVLRTVLGRGHRDYQALRLRRSSAVAEDSEADALVDDEGDADLAQLEAEVRAESVPPGAGAEGADVA